MAFTLIDYFKAFHFMKEQLKLSAGAQAVYFSILGEFNAARFPERISLSHRDLKELAGLKSVASVHDAKNVLKNKGLIDFTSAGNTTSYRILAEHLPNICQSDEASPCKRACVDVRQETGDTKKSSTTGARVRVEWNGETTREQPNNPTSPNPTTPEVEPPSYGWDLETEERLSRLWVSNNGARVTAELLSYLQVLVEKHGVAWVEEVIRAAARAYGGQYSMNVEWLQGAVERKLKAAARRDVRGGERNDGQAVGANRDGQYHLPKRTGTEPWRKS